MVLRFFCWLWLSLGLTVVASLKADTGAVPDEVFSEAEQAWLAAHPVVRLAPDPNFPPIEFIDNAGQYRGIAADYLALIAENLGIRFHIVQLNSWDEILSRIKRGEIDMLGAADDSPQRKEYLDFTKPYLQLPAAIITRTDVEEPISLKAFGGKKVALVAGSIWEDILAERYPQLVSVPVVDISSGLRELAQGKVDAMVLNQASARYQIRKLEMTELKLAGLSTEPGEYRFAVRRDWPELKDILEKVLAKISAEKKQVIKEAWLRQQSTDDFIDIDARMSADADKALLTIKHAKNMITQLQAERDMSDAVPLDEQVRKKALEYYQLAGDVLIKDEETQARVETFRRALKSAPGEIQKIQQDLDLIITVREDALAALGISAENTLDELEHHLTREQVRLNALQSQLADDDHRITELQGRPEKANRELSEIRKLLERVEQELKAPASEDENPIVDEARDFLLKTRQRLLKRRVLLLEQETLSHSVRLDLIRAQRDMVAQQLSQAEDRVEQLQDLISRLREQEASQMRANADQERQAMLGKAPRVRQVAEVNVELSQRLAEALLNIDSLSGKLTQIDTELNRIDQEYQNAKQQLEIVGIGDTTLGEVFRRLRKELHDLDHYHKNAEKRKKSIVEARLEQFRIDRQRREQRDIKREVEAIIEEDAGVAMDDTQSGALEAELYRLFQTRQALLDKLSKQYHRYVKVLVELDLEEKRLTERIQQYSDLLRKRLLWIPSHDRVDAPWPVAVMSSMYWLISVEHWQEVGRTLFTEIGNNLPLTILVLILFVVLLQKRKSLYRRMLILNSYVGDASKDSFKYTLISIGIILLIALPIPLLLRWLAWLLQSPSAESPYANAVGGGLFEVSIYYFHLTAYRYLCRNSGVAEVHFGWSNQSTSVQWRNLRWFIAVSIPFAFLVGISEHQPLEMHRDTIGRSAFVIISVALSVYAWRVLHPERGALAGVIGGRDGGWIARVRHIYYPLMVLIPLMFSALALLGYYYSALQLELKVFDSLELIIAAVLIYNLLLRGFLVAQQRLALARVRDKFRLQQAARQHREAAESSGTASPESLEVPEITLESINEQTRTLLSLAVGLFVIVSLWMVWEELLPALGVLEEIPLWHRSVNRAGVVALEQITLGDSIQALLVVLATYFAGRNLPGLMEIVLLQRMNLISGTRYAIATLIRYTIIAVGIIVAFSLLGVGWSDVQWLVAAISVGLGFGVREIIGSYIGGLIILFERPLRVGDYVTLGEVTGTVLRIHIRATTLVDADNKEQVFPNITIVTRQLTNWTLSDEAARAIIKVAIAHGSDTALARKVMLDVAEANPRVLQDPPPRVFFLGFGENALEFEVRFFMKEHLERASLLHDLHMALEQGLRDHGIRFPKPQLDVSIAAEKEQAGKKE